MLWHSLSKGMMTHKTRSVLARVVVTAGICALGVVGMLCWRVRSRVDPSDWPRWPPRMDYSPKRMAMCANRFIAMGEEEAYKRLHDAALDDADGSSLYLLCLALYGGDSDKPLRCPIVGFLFIDCFESADGRDWPALPLVVIDDIPFAVRPTRGFLAGVPESGRSYLDYCRANGRFRRRPYRIPTREEASKAVDAFLASEKWKKIEKKQLDSQHDSSYGGFGGIGVVMNYLRKQVDNIDGTISTQW